MKKIFVGTLSVLALSGAVIVGFTPEAKAVLQMDFTAPFALDTGKVMQQQPSITLPSFS